MYTNSTISWLEKILFERFGHHFRLIQGDNLVKLTYPNQEGEIIFDCLDPAFNSSSSSFPCFFWNTNVNFLKINEEIPAPATFPLKEPLIQLSPKQAHIHYDIIGLTYWMLTRKEEIGRTDLDEHQRFPATSSHAFRNGYLELPIIDLWLDILARVIKLIWPRLPLKKHQFSIQVSHDVDAISQFQFLSFPKLLREMSNSIVTHRDFNCLKKAPRIWLSSKQQIHPMDNANTFEWLMTQSESNGLRSTFYFICGRTNASKDALYDIEMPVVRALMKQINERGHEIGLHPSYHCYHSPSNIRKELKKLKTIFEEENINQKRIGCRMHYLRWDQSTTLKGLSDAGLAYDSTLGYADRPGFRCGTSFEYPAFDLTSDKELPIRISPLIAMDCSIIANRYLGLGSTEKAYERFYKLKTETRNVSGRFTLLWHNNSFNKLNDFEIYSRLINRHI